MPGKAKSKHRKDRLPKTAVPGRRVHSINRDAALLWDGAICWFGHEEKQACDKTQTPAFSGGGSSYRCSPRLPQWRQQGVMGRA